MYFLHECLIRGSLVAHRKTLQATVPAVYVPNGNSQNCSEPDQSGTPPALAGLGCSTNDLTALRTCIDSFSSSLCLCLYLCPCLVLQ